MGTLNLCGNSNEMLGFVDDPVLVRFKLNALLSNKHVTEMPFSSSSIHIIFGSKNWPDSSSRYISFLLPTLDVVEDIRFSRIFFLKSAAIDLIGF